MKRLRLTKSTVLITKSPSDPQRKEINAPGNLINHQGVKAHEHWAPRVFWEVGCSGGADPTGIRLPCLDRNIVGKQLIINYLELVMASPGSGDCRFSLSFYVVPPCPVPPLDSEKVAIGEALWPKEKEDANKRMKAGKPSGNLPGGNGDTRERVAKVVGWSGQTYGRAKDVVEVSECESLSEADRAFASSFYGVKSVYFPKGEHKVKVRSQMGYSWPLPMPGNEQRVVVAHVPCSIGSVQ